MTWFAAVHAHRAAARLRHVAAQPPCVFCWRPSWRRIGGEWRCAAHEVRPFEVFQSWCPCCDATRPVLMRFAQWRETPARCDSCGFAALVALGPALRAPGGPPPAPLPPIPPLFGYVRVGVAR